MFFSQFGKIFSSLGLTQDLFCLGPDGLFFLRFLSWRDAEKYVAQPDSVGLVKFSISVQVVILFDILLAHLDLGGEMGVGVGYVFDANF